MSTTSPTPTSIRCRRRTNAATAATVRVSIPLPEAAKDALSAISGDRPLEELVVLAAAAAWTTSIAERSGEVTLSVCGPDGSTAVTAALDCTVTPISLIGVLDAALRSTENRPEQAGHGLGLMVGSARVDGPAGPELADARPEGAGLTLTLGAPDGSTRALTAEMSPELAESWYAHVFLRAVATTLVAFGSPRRPLAEAPTGAAEDVAAALRFSWSGFAPEPAPRTLTGPIAEAAVRYRDRPAVAAAEGTLTYDQLWRAAGAVAVALGEAGVGAGDRVGLLTGKSIYALAGILGILRARAAYVPIDVHLSMTRAIDILQDAGAGVVLSVGTPAAELAKAWPGATVLDLESPGFLDGDLLDVDGAPDPAATLPVAEPDDLAYVMYTSGSTGTPKGVAVRHRAVASYVSWKVAHNGLDEDVRALQIPSHAFDSSISDLFPVLAAGGLLILVDSARRTPAELVAMIQEHRVTQFIIVPTLYRLLLDELGPAVDSLRLVTVAGEVMPADLVARHRKALPKVRLLNEYGPTENAVGATIFDYDGDSGYGSPIGVPLSNTVVRVAGTDGRTLPPGFVGELRLSGHGVGDGYLGRPDLTAAAFTTEASVPGAREYRTGDLGWWRLDGVLEFAGRADDQVKIRGQRVEPREVEAVLAGVAGVRAAVVVATADVNGAAVLTAFVEAVTSGQADVDRSEAQVVAAIRAAAAPRLSSAMLPGRFVLLTELPRLMSGKPDRQALAASAARVGDHEDLERVAPVADGRELSDGLEPVEVTVVEIFRDALGVPVGPDDDLFLLGGHSLLAISVLSAIETRLGSMLDLDDFFDEATPRAVAARVRAKGAVNSVVRPDGGLQVDASGSADALAQLLDEL